MNRKELIEISGVVDSVIYENEENGYTICEIEDEDGYPVVLSGTMPHLGTGDMLNVKGQWVIHPTYGKQLKVVSYEKTLPVGRDSILRYLASGAVKGIGPKTAVKIVDRFGDVTFDVLRDHPEWLSEISGISRKKAIEIGESYKEVADARNVMIFFKDMLSDNISMKLYRKWGGAAIDKIKENPYLLCREFSGIGFAKADEVALGMGIDKNSPFRIEGGLTAVIQNAASRAGHTCLPLEELKDRCSKLLEIDAETVHDTVLEMLIAGKMRVVTTDGVKYIYLASMYKAEKYISDKLLSLERQCAGFELSDIGRMIDRLERQNGITYDEMQRRAIEASLKSGIMILTGGPGTGKTTVIKAMITIFGELGMEIALAAPTGRAAKRMSDATSTEAKTLHRLLCMEYSDEDNCRFAKDESDRLDEDVFIIDECSMIDTSLAEAFLKAVKPGARIILIGDSDQLPSVGAGNILSDLIRSERFNTVKLTKIFRQSENSFIVSNAHLINEGKMPEISGKDGDFFFLSRPSDESTARTIAELCKTRLPKTYGKAASEGIQVMTPSRKGTCGTDSLNAMLQEYLNPPEAGKKERRFRERVFREGDRVMQTKNNYSIEWSRDGSEGCGIYNGDIGVIEKIDHSSSEMTIRFDDKLCSYDFTLLEDIEHAWAITVHKSQGSEYPFVIIPLYSCAPMLLTRNLFYTAVTRAERMVILVGKKEIISKMVSNDRQAVRYTGLYNMLVNKD